MMIRSVKYKDFIRSIKDSYRNSREELRGRPFNENALWAFGSNRYETTTEFMDELGGMMLTIESGRMSEYIEATYQEITFYGCWFKLLIDEYKRKYVCEDGRLALDITKYDLLYSLEAYRRTEAYEIAIGETADTIRKDAAKYLKIKLRPYQELTIDDYTIDGRFIEKPAITDNIVDDGVKLSHAQISILYIINEWPLNDNNAKDIAEKYGLSSGKKLMDYKKDLENKEIRTGCAKHTIKNYKAIEKYILSEKRAQFEQEKNKAIENNTKK